MYARYRDMVGGVDCASYAWNARPRPCRAWRCTMEIPIPTPRSRVGLWIFGQHETDTRIISDFEP
jgi:hypothetical protein